MLSKLAVSGGGGAPPASRPDEIPVWVAEVKALAAQRPHGLLLHLDSVFR
jgi:hypothetical protein